MRSHLRLGRLLGVPIGLNIWVLVIAGVLAVSLAAVSLPAIAPAHPRSAYWFAAALGVIAFMVSLVAHELGHSWVAMRNGVQVSEITLWLFGGVAKLEREADDPGTEFRIAAAGPAMSAVCALAAAGAAWGVERMDGSEVLVGLFVWLAAINAVLAVTNLLPAFPLDGGRILRAVLWRRKGRRIAATRTAALWGQILAAVIVAVGVWATFAVGITTGLWTTAVGLFLFVAARAEWIASAPDPAVLRTPVGEVRRTLPPPLTPTASVADAQRCLDANPGAPLVALGDRQGTLASLVTRDGVGRIPPAQRALVPASSVAEPMVALPRVSGDEPVEDVMARLGQGGPWWALVVGGDGSLGALVSSDVDRLVEVARG